MKFRSILGVSPAVSFREALFRGLAPDGSLYVPEHMPRLEACTDDADSEQLLPAVASRVLSAFIDDIPADELLNMAKRAFNFPIPLTRLEDDLYLLELFHGPTLAFKDVGARFMAEALSYFLKREQRDLTIAVATSGDTGSAVAHGFFNIPRVAVFVLYPSGKISTLQEQQMTTLGGNIHALEVEGTFDDCQRLVKRALADPGLVAERNLTTANSINLGRLVPQISYYLWGLQLHGNHPDVFDREARGVAPFIAVPSGNFGNLTAAVYAKRMGAAIAGFVSATNVNDVVPEYLNSGTYRPRPSLQTISNAMDVGDPSNFARLRAVYGNNIDEMRRDISGVSITDAETIGEIRKTYDRSGKILDPHTAVAVAATRKLKTSHSLPRPVIIAGTAHPAKFPDVIAEALHIPVPLPRQLEDSLRLPKQSTKIAAEYDHVRKLFLA